MSRIKHLKKEAHVVLPTSGESYVSDDGTVSVVLDDHYDPNYEPSEKEISEYAEWLGMTLPDDEELLWIAKEGLRAPLPKEWKPCKTDTDEVYYFNFKTGESIWDHPLDEYFKGKYKQEKDKLLKEKLEGRKVERMKPKEDRLVIGAPTPLVVAAAAAAAAAASSSTSSTSTAKASPAPAASVEAPAALTAKVTALPSGGAAGTTSATSQRGSASATTGASASATATVSKKTPEAAPVAATSRDPKPATSAPIAAPVANTYQQPAPAPSAEQQPAARLLTEADKLRLERARKEMEQAQKDRIADAEEGFNNALSRIRLDFARDVSALKAKTESATREATRRAEEAVAETTERKQREIEARHKGEISRMQTDIDGLRDKLRDVKNAQASDIAHRNAEIDASIHTRVSEKLNSLRAEIATLKERHATAQHERLHTAKANLEADIQRAIQQVTESSAAEYQTAARQVQDRHDTEMAQIRRLHETNLTGLRERREAAAKGHTASALAGIENSRRSRLQQIADEVAAETQRARRDHDAEMARIEAMGASGGDVSAAAPAEELARIDAETDERIKQATVAKRREWEQRRGRLEQDRAAQLALIRSAQIAPNEPSGGQVATTMLADQERAIASRNATRLEEQRAEHSTALEASRRQWRRQREDKVSALRSQLEADAAAALDRNKTAAADAASSAADDESRQSAALTEAEVARLRKEAESQQSDLECDATRASAESTRKAILALADEIAETERTRKREIDSEVASRAAARTSVSPPQSRRTVEATPAPVVQHVTVKRTPRPSEVEDAAMPALEIVQREFVQREAATRARWNEKVAVDLGALREKQSVELAQAQDAAAEASGYHQQLHAANVTPRPVAPAVDNFHDAMRYVEEQHREASERRDALNQVRSTPELPPRPTSRATTGGGSRGGPSEKVVAALSLLDSRLDALFEKLEGQVQGRSRRERSDDVEHSARRHRGQSSKHVGHSTRRPSSAEKRRASSAERARRVVTPRGESAADLARRWSGALGLGDTTAAVAPPVPEASQNAGRSREFR